MYLGAYLIINVCRMKKTDVLLIARPDHSLRIFKELNKTQLSYCYYTFKVFPKWVKSIIKDSRIVCLNGNFKSSISVTIYNILVFKFHLKLSSIISENKLFENFIYPRIKNINSLVIHYWPKYCKKSIEKYKKQHPKTNTIADIYMPNPQFILDYMGPILEPLGLKENLDYILLDNQDLKDIMSYEDNFLVPSSFVADTYKKYYPNKNYFIIPYGISIWEHYHKKTIPHSIKTFVYAGTISIEKGCDLICEYFRQHNDYELHLYGEMKYNEKHLFATYRKFSNIVFHGSVAKSVLQEEIAKYNVGVHMSRFDAYSLSVGEIVGTGIPVIVSENTGIKDDVERYNWGMVCGLSVDEFDCAVKRMSDLNNYCQFQTSIDQYISDNPIKYEEKVVRLYSHLCNEK